MPLQLPDVPNFGVPTPQAPTYADRLQNQIRLQALMGNQQLLPLQVEEQNEKVKQAQIQTQQQQMMLQGQQAEATYMLHPEQFDTPHSEQTSASRLAATLQLPADDPIVTTAQGIIKAGKGQMGAVMQAFSYASSMLTTRRTAQQGSVDQQKIHTDALGNLKTISTPIAAEKDPQKQAQMLATALPELADAAKYDPVLSQAVQALASGKLNVSEFANRIGNAKDVIEYGKAQSQAAAEAQKVIPPGQAMSPETQQQVQKDIAVATNPQIQAGKEKVAREEGISRANIEAQMARGSQAALANVPPHLIPPATEAATKAGTEYAQAKSVSDRIAEVLADARKGNKVAYQLLPQEGALQVTTSQGVHRINMAEIQNYGGGSLWDSIVGKAGKVLTGESIPKNILDDMEKIQTLMSEGSRSKYENTLKTINQSYGASFKPVEMESLKTPGALQIGQTVSIKGKQMTVTAVHADGSFDAK